MSTNGYAALYEYLQGKYEGKIHKIERTHDLIHDKLIVRVEFRIPADGVDELEMFKRIHSVIEVIAEG
jgi:hypothetical protein